MTRWTLIMLALLSLVSFGGCDADVTAVSGTEMPYSMYGLLSPDLTMQKVLVYPIEGTLQPRGTEPIDADVRSVDLVSDEELIWADSLVVDSAGLNEHVFQAPFQAEYGHTYRLSVTRSDGAETYVETRVPPRTEVVTGVATVFPGIVTLPALINGDAPRLLNIVVAYLIGFVPIGEAPELLEVPLSYDGEQERSEDGWVIPINLAGDIDLLERAAVDESGSTIDQTYGLRLEGIRLRLIVASEEWDPPGGIFDPEVLVQAGTMSNVENGYGFVGAGYRHDEQLELPEEDVLDAAGFTVVGQ